MHSKVLFQIREFALLHFLYRVVLIVWVIFAIYKFQINPIFFSLSILAALFFVGIIAETSIILKENELEIKHSCWLWILNRSSSIKLADIKSLEINNGKYDKTALVLNLIEYVPGTFNKRKKLVILLNDDSIKEYECIGLSRENKKLVELIKIIKADNSTT